MKPAELRALIEQQKEMGLSMLVVTVDRGARRPRFAKRMLGQNAPIIGSTETRLIVSLDVAKADKWLRERGV